MLLSFGAIAEYLEHPDVHVHEHFPARFNQIEYLNPNRELRKDILYLCTITEFSLHNHRIENQSFVIVDDLGLHEKINISKEVNSMILTNKQTQFSHLQQLNGLFSDTNRSFIELQRIILEEQDTDAFWQLVMELIDAQIIVEQDGLTLYPKILKEKITPALIKYETKIMVSDIEFTIIVTGKKDLTYVQVETLNALEPLFFQILKRYTASFEPMEKKMSKIILNLLQSQTPIIRPLEDTVWEDRESFDFFLATLPDKTDSVIQMLSDIDPVSVLSIPVQDTLLVLYAVDPLQDLSSKISTLLTKHTYTFSKSYRFSQIEELQNVWKALRIHLQIRKKNEIKGESHIGNAVLSVLTEEYRSYADIFPFIHDVIWQMLASDDKESKDLLDTLYIYLLNERSYLKTSKEMDLHRNSIVYRINKITTKYELDLEDPNVRQNLLLSCQLLKI